jgi:hypothetical protein
MQFSLRSLMGLVLASAALCGVFFAAPALVALPILAAAAFLLPAVVVTTLVYSRGAGKAFALGCLSVGAPFALYLNYVGVMLVAAGEFDWGEITDGEAQWAYKLFFAAYFAALCLPGLTSLAVRRMILGPQRAPSRAAPFEGCVAPGRIVQGRASLGASRRVESSPTRARRTWRLGTLLGAASLLALAVMTADVALLGGMLTVCLLVLAVCLSPAAVISAIVYARGAGRAFAIGLLSVAWAPMLLGPYLGVVIMFGGLSPFDASVASLLIGAALGAGLALAGGGIGVAVRRWSLPAASGLSPDQSLLAASVRSIAWEPDTLAPDDRQLSLFSPFN